MALPSKINPPWTLGQARAAVNSLIDHLAQGGTPGTGETIQVGGSQPSSGWWLDTGTTTPPPDPGAVHVTATTPTWTDDTTNGGGTWSSPTITGLTYSPATGTATPGQAVTVTVTAQSGYVNDGPSSFSHTFPVAPGAVGEVITDTFNRANTSAGGVGVAETGQAWQDAETKWAITSNTVGATASGQATKPLQANLGVTDANVKADVIVKNITAGRQGGVIARADLDGKSFYHARVNSATNTIELFRFVDGAATSLSTSPLTVTAGTYAVELAVEEVSGQTHLVVKVGGTTHITYDDTAATRPTGTRVGLRCLLAATDVAFDNFSATEIA